MAQQIRVFATKPEDLSGIYRMEELTPTRRSLLHMHYGHTPTPMYTHTQNKYHFKKFKEGLEYNSVGEGLFDTHKTGSVLSQAKNKKQKGE